MIVVFTDEALLDLEEIGDFIGRDNPPRAASFVAELREKCLGLAQFPEAFPLVERLARIGTRRRRHRNYLIFYRIAKNAIVIQHILHGARDYDAILAS